LGGIKKTKQNKQFKKGFKEKTPKKKKLFFLQQQNKKKQKNKKR
jgi:hypothetical protein